MAWAGETARTHVHGGAHTVGAWWVHGIRTACMVCTVIYALQATHEGWRVRYGGGELSTEWVTSGQVTSPCREREIERDRQTDSNLVETKHASLTYNSTTQRLSNLQPCAPSLQLCVPNLQPFPPNMQLYVIASGQAALLWHTLTPTMHSRSLPEAPHARHARLGRARARRMHLINARPARAPAAPGGSGRLDNPRGETVPLGAQALRRVLELAASKVRRPPPALCSPRRPRWPGTQLPRCSDTTLSAPPPNEHPAWSWDETPHVYRRGALCGEWMPTLRAAEGTVWRGCSVSSLYFSSSHFRRKPFHLNHAQNPASNTLRHILTDERPLFITPTHKTLPSLARVVLKSGWNSF